MYALTTHQLQVERRERQSQSSVCAHHTPAIGGEERETQSQEVGREVGRSPRTGLGTSGLCYIILRVMTAFK